ncbi:MAG: Gfo/Idh/MocA family protein [Armatimonadota bacterium]
MPDIRLGILGVGGFGLFCLEQYRQMPGVRITAIGGKHREKYARLAAEYAIPFYTVDWHELVTHPEVDVVYLATPPDLRGAPAIAALEAGKHVFCEKPLALSLNEADRMLAAAEGHGVRLGINFVMRYAGLYDLLGTLVNAGVLGQPLHFSFVNEAGDLPADHWFWDARRSGGIPVEHGVHFFDIFSAIFGQGEVQWAGRRQRPNGAEDKWQAVLSYSDHMFGSFYHAFDMPGPLEETRAVIAFERGRVSLDGWIPMLLSIDGLLHEGALAAITALLPSAVTTPLPEGEQSFLANGTSFTATHRVTTRVDAGDKQAVYARAVRDALADFLVWTQDARHLPRVTGHDARAALRTALAVRDMARR